MVQGWTKTKASLIQDSLAVKQEPMDKLKPGMTVFKPVLNRI